MLNVYRKSSHGSSDMYLTTQYVLEWQTNLTSYTEVPVTHVVTLTESQYQKKKEKKNRVTKHEW